MMRIVHKTCGIAVLALAACAAPIEPAPSRSFDLDLTHPAANANYIQVAPKQSGLPDPQDILSPSFSAYLRGQTGCVVDASRPSVVLGHREIPAGYMVAVVCP